MVRALLASDRRRSQPRPAGNNYQRKAIGPVIVTATVQRPKEVTVWQILYGKHPQPARG